VYKGKFDLIFLLDLKYNNISLLDCKIDGLYKNVSWL